MVKMTLANNYIYKALDAYPWCIEESVEALNYALSYDEKDATALTLAGRIQAEVLKDYENAKQYFQEALTENVNAHQVYPFYIETLLKNEDFNEAEKLIDFALTVKGSNKAMLYVKKAMLFECKQEYKIALKHLKQAKIASYSESMLEDISSHKKRIKSKLPKEKKSKKDTKSKSKKKKNKKRK